MPDVSYGSLPFSEQIAYFRRKLNLTTEDWTQLFGAAHDHAFVVAGANREDLVAGFREAIDKAIANGGTLADFRKDFDAIVAKHGWDYNGGRNWRSRVIYETNLRTSYAAGRYAQLQAVKKSRPYWQYVHSDAVQHPRPQHLAWNGKVLHADDPWWQTHYPPNGWGCQCTVHALSARDLERLGKAGPDEAPPKDITERTIGQRGAHPRTVQVPAGIDPGFGHAPGASVSSSWLAPRAEQALELGEGRTAGGWRRLLTSDWQTYQRPQRVPFFEAPASAAAPVQNQAELVARLIEALGAEQRVIDVHGLPVALDVHALARHVPLDRSPYAALIADALENPWEVWLSLEQHVDSGYYDLRARVFKGYDIGRDRSLMFVASADGGLLQSWTYFITRDRRYINNQREGMLWYGQ